MCGRWDGVVLAQVVGRLRVVVLASRVRCPCWAHGQMTVKREKPRPALWLVGASELCLSWWTILGLNQCPLPCQKKVDQHML